MMTRDKIETLGRVSTPEWPTISLYLRIDKERIDEDFTIRLKNLISGAADNLDPEYSHDQRQAVLDDLDRIKEFVRDKQDRYGRGLALIVNSHEELWEAIEIPSQIDSSITIGPSTNVYPLIRLLETVEPYCTCLISRDQSRIFYSELGHIEELSQSRNDMVPGQHEQGGWSQARYERHIQEHVRGHFKDTAAELQELEQKRPFRLLVLGGTDEVVSGFVEMLHPYVKERHVGTVRLLPEANINEVEQDSQEVIGRWLEGEKQRTLDALKNQAPEGELRATGLQSTIRALQRGQVMTLILDEAFESPGAVCENCGSLQIPDETESAKCIYCGGALQDRENIVPDVVLGAFQQGARVIFLDSADQRQQAREFGEIGALLRFAVEPEQTG